MNKKLILSAGFILASLSVFSQKDSVELSEVVVTGTRSQVNRNNVPMTISVVNREEIEQSSESALLPVLSEQVPSMFITERGVTGFGVSTGGTGGITLRGIGGSPTTEVLVLIDGHPQYMGVMGHHLPDAYVASDVERVEVVRGPASILYGSNAMGGAINIITRRQNREGWNANARLMYGSYNTQKYQANGGFRKNKFDIFASINHDRTDGHRRNSAFNITNGYVRAGYDISKNFRLWGDFSLADYEAQNPGTVTLPMFDNIANIIRGAGSATFENKFDKTDGALKLFYNFGNHEINDGFTNVPPNQQQVMPPVPLAKRDYLFRSKDKNFGAALYQNFRLFEGNLITAGVDFKTFGGHVWNDSLGSRPNKETIDTTVYEIAGYIVAQQELFEKLTLTAGIRFENNEVFGNEWVPQAGLAYRPLKHTTIKGSVSKGFRSPTIRELFLNMPNPNPNLKPEKLINYEISVGQSFLQGKIYAELTGYIAEGDNIIQITPVAGKQTPINAGNFSNKGIELSARWQVIKGLKLHGNYSYMHLKNPIPAAPEQQAFLSATYSLQKWNFNASYQYIHNLYLALGQTPQKDSYGLLNAKVSYQALKWLGVFAKGENLTDTEYSIVSGYPMPGVTVFGGVNLSF
ncbi:MAG: TonB-dependent receptor [Prevotellaceae bacterium]|jgi:iron complex outermembrane receptor protein|nr:TonB-dependent receptor [Prevotellaceae bacterium]